MNTEPRCYECQMPMSLIGDVGRELVEVDDDMKPTGTRTVNLYQCRKCKTVTLR